MVVYSSSNEEHAHYPVMIFERVTQYNLHLRKVGNLFHQHSPFYGEFYYFSGINFSSVFFWRKIFSDPVELCRLMAFAARLGLQEFKKMPIDLSTNIQNFQQAINKYS